MEYRVHIVQLLILMSCLATVLCKELSSSVNRESIQRPYTKDGKLVDPSDPWSRKRYHAADVHPPKRIMKLMQQLSKNEDLLKERGNTVRSYLPNLRFACNEPTYVFSIKSHKTESLRSVELHFFASKPSNLIDSESTIDIHLHLITNTSSACQPIGVQQRPAKARGWQVIDVTAQIAHLLKPILESENSQITVGVSFRLQETGGSHDTSRERTTNEKIMSNHARPFLLVYAEDDDSSGNSVLQWTQEGAKTKTAPSETTHPMEARSPTQVRSHTRHARSVDGNVHSIMTNEFPEGSTNVAHQATFQHFNEQDSKRRKAKKRTSKKRKRVSKKQHRKAPLLDPSSSVVEDESEEQAAMNDDRDQNTVLPMSPNDGPCSRHAMFVSFDTIDWDGYVIAPTGFEAFYCTGACSFPLSKTDNPSNHATIQSVMSVAGIQAKIPPPCCVPEKLTSLSILFLDENDNVGLKSYKNMVVESCGCR
ncbi:growth/differentiation factor 10-like isoform X2 [Patiria miniata]|uniref:TGF-beta family profile domain-containing protein n=1 Tax=Patiria miniata TaxID=46514 RepID=A0A914AFF1_PATMI|nr:growth/differentiation factor 10-like isoform X2 [Patiria miniata]